MPRRLLAPLLILTAAFAPAAEDPFAEHIVPVLEDNCFDCHGGNKRKGGINFEHFTSGSQIAGNLELWETAMRMVAEHEMPPPDQAEMITEDRLAFVDHLTTALQQAYEQVPADPGHVVFHRLSRTEYNNTIRDLLGVDAQPADNFPADGSGGGGFDNNAATLFMQPLLMEKMLRAADEVLAQADPKAYISTRPEGDDPAAAVRAAHQSLADFATRAWRRPVDPKGREIRAMLRVYGDYAKREVPYEVGVRHLCKAILASPQFIYRWEPKQNSSKPYPVDHYSMASRLSYMLWASMPDQELLKLAAAEQLQDDAVIAKQVERMLADPKGHAVYDQFVPQWVGTAALRDGGPDPGKFPEVESESFRNQPVVFFADLVQRNASILEFISSKQGLLGMPAIYAATSHANRTSPTIRGRWVAEVLLHAPPPPPPPNVPSLPEKTKEATGAQTVRERLIQHVEDPNCSGCHARIDPLGFALENYDPVGRWRDRWPEGAAIDHVVDLPGAKRIDGVEGVRALAMERKDAFARGFVERLLAYAIGRGLQSYDRQVVTGILEATAPEYKARDLIVQVALSYPFRYKRNRPVTR